jgi:hypothetical protein
MQQLVAVLEDAWATIRQHHAEIPEVVVLVGTGTDRGGALRKLGHFAARRWRLADGGERSEILVAGEGLDRSPHTVLATLLHEAAHALAFARGIRDTSQGGRYHNRRFAAVAAELGLQATLLRPYGLAWTAMLPATEARYAAPLGELTEVLVLWRAAKPPRTRASSGRAGPGVPCRCACPRAIRLPRRVLQGAPWSAAAVERRFFPASLGGDPVPARLSVQRVQPRSGQGARRADQNLPRGQPRGRGPGLHAGVAVAPAKPGPRLPRSQR